MLSVEQLLGLQAMVDEVFVHHAVLDYAVRLVMATRDPAAWGLPELAPYMALGASPRATLGLVAAGRALALLRGRRFLLPQDVFDVAPEVLRHRLILTYDALAEGITVDQVLSRLLSTVPAPRVTPQQDDSYPEAVPPSEMPVTIARGDGMTPTGGGPASGGSSGSDGRHRPDVQPGPAPGRARGGLRRRAAPGPELAAAGQR